MPANPELTAERDALAKENADLRLRLLSAAGDDLCRLTQEEIKAYSSGAVKIPPREEFIPSCERFHAQTAGTVGVLENCLTLAQLVAENQKLTNQLAEAERERDDAIAERDSYKKAYDHAINCVDRVFQADSTKPPPLLPDYLQIGACKFEGILELAEDYQAAQAELPATFYSDRPLAERLKLMVSEWKKAKEGCEELREELAKAQKHCEQVNRQWQEQRDKVTHFQFKVEGLQKELAEARETIEGLRRERDEAIKDRDAWTAEWNDERNKISSLQSRLEQAEGLAARLNQSRRECAAELQKYWDKRVYDSWELMVLTKAREALNDPPIPPALSQFESGGGK